MRRFLTHKPNFLLIKIITLPLLLISFFASAHGGSDAVVDEWKSLTLTVKASTNWPTEYCVDILDVYNLNYSFESDEAMIYDFHVHPINEKDEHITEFFSQQKSVKTESGKITTHKAGTYCFNYFPSKKTGKDSVIHLKYRIETIKG